MSRREGGVMLLLFVVALCVSATSAAQNGYVDEPPPPPPTVPPATVAPTDPPTEPTTPAPTSAAAQAAVSEVMPVEPSGYNDKDAPPAPPPPTAPPIGEEVTDGYGAGDAPVPPPPEEETGVPIVDSTEPPFDPTDPPIDEYPALTDPPPEEEYPLPPIDGEDPGDYGNYGNYGNYGDYIGRRASVKKQKKRIQPESRRSSSRRISKARGLKPPTHGEDAEIECCFWAKMGECSTNQFYMRPWCQKSCGTTGCSVASAHTCSGRLDVAECPWTDADVFKFKRALKRKKAVLKKSRRHSPRRVDKHELCAFWAHSGQCSKEARRAKMWEVCPKSCALARSKKL